jgi:hypothetical protein
VSVPAGTVETNTSTINVTATGTLASVYVELDGVTSDGEGRYASLSNAAFMLTAPNGTTKLLFLGATGDGTDGNNSGNAGSGVSGITITVEDGKAAAPGPSNGSTYPNGWGTTTPWTVGPSSYFNAWGYDSPILGSGSSQWANPTGPLPSPPLTVFP